MDIKSIIKNAVAQRLQESIKIEEPATPEITTTSEFVNFLAEAVKFKMEELKINKDISRETVGRMKKAGVSREARREFTKDDVARAEGDRARNQKMKDDEKGGEGFERAVHVQTHGAAASPNNNKTKPMSPEKIRGAGLAGKTVGGVPREKRLAKKMHKIKQGNAALLSRLADKEN